MVADNNNNALLIHAPRRDYKRIEAALRQLDITPNQVLIEASIVEVTLTDETKYGLQWYFEGGLGNGGWNFDAKVRRQSIDAVDLMHGHIGGIDVIARGLLRAAALIEQGQLERFRAERYAGWQGELGRMIHAEGTTLAAVADRAVQSNSAPQPRSGRQEWCENLINRA